MQKPQRIMIIRHAEKPDADSKGNTTELGRTAVQSEESLTVRGWQTRWGDQPLVRLCRNCPKPGAFSTSGISTHPIDLKKQTKLGR